MVPSFVPIHLLRLLLTVGCFLLFTFQVVAQTFTQQNYPAATPASGSLARADMNNDAFPDLINAGGPNVFVLINNGDGTFRTPLQYNAGGGDVFKVMATDVNGDAHPDVIAAHGTPSGQVQIAILLGNGDGTLRAPTQLSQTFPGHCGTFRAPVLFDFFCGFDIADFNRDGRPDLVVGFVDDSGVNHMTVLYGNGSAFGNPREFSGFGRVGAPDENNYMLVAIAAGDYNGDGKADIAIGEAGGGYEIDQSSISVFYGNGDGTFRSEVFEAGGTGIYAIRTVNGNNDGLADLAVLYNGCHTPCVGVEIFMGDQSGLGHKAVLNFFTDNVNNGPPRAVAIADFTGDGLPDVAVAVEHYNVDGLPTPAILLYDQPPGETDTPNAVLPIQATDLSSDLVAGDFNRDGRWDFVTANGDDRNITEFTNTTAGIGCAFPSANRTVNVCAPAAGSTVTSPVIFRFNPRTTTQITGMKIYVDGVWKFLSQGEELAARLIIGPGTHSVEVKAWDNAGPFSKSFTLKVSGDAGSCQPASSARAVTICTPNPNEWQATVVHFTANANGTQVVATQIYVDDKLKYEVQNYALDTQLTLDPGRRRITIKGWDAQGSFSKSIVLWVYGGACKPDVAVGGRGLTVCSPQQGSTYTDSRVPIQAVAVSPNTIASFTVQWQDSTPEQFAQSWVDEISSPPSGYNTYRFTATDSVGTMTKSVTVLVGTASCPAPTTRTVVICSPTNGQTVRGIFTLSASAGNPSGTFVELQIYQDNTLWYRTSSPFINIATSLPAGTHRLTAKGWDAQGAYSTAIYRDFKWTMI